ncbi:hypothetical protein BB561_001182 [Smittium simulii]|uniref:Uncharacterized protein n=1 Tax=Smittium simulii TaxID=133385 RepID=A0A2T9YVT5_9FUNG|nr:hypothetical protein BB561_001182 [Smittium simulii]
MHRFYRHCLGNNDVNDDGKDIKITFEVQNMIEAIPFAKNSFRIRFEIDKRGYNGQILSRISRESHMAL